MAFPSSFRVNIAMRVALLAVLLFALLWSLLRTGWDAVPLFCALLLVLFVVELVRYVEAGTRDLATLLRSVAAGDFTTSLPRRSRRPPFSDYQQASRTLIQAYQRLDLQRAASDELLRAVIDHVGIAVLCYTASGRLAFANPEARRLLGIAEASSLDALAATDARLPAQLLAIENDQRLQLELQLRGETAVLLLHARRFSLLGEPFTVVVCHDIREELESRDLQAWQRLTRVLTHEMMNSLTPIVTLSGHLRDILDGQPERDPDVRESIGVIHERGSGLARFIEAYRQFSHPPTPAPQDVAAAALLERVARLMRPELEAQGIRLEVAPVPTDALVHADVRQVEQVLINLIRNAQQSLAGQAQGTIELAADPVDSRVLLHVTDDGPGIAPHLLDQVFVPFFSTRKAGSGVGLALSRQLMQLNRGTLSVASQPGRCRFTLRLPAAS